MRFLQYTRFPAVTTHEMSVARVINELKAVVKIDKCSPYGKTALHLSLADTRADKLCLEWPKLTQILFGG